MKLKEYEKKKARQREVAIALLESGVDFADLDSVYIDENVTVGEGTFIGPCVTLEGSTAIGRNCKIYQNTRICDCQIGDEVTVQSSVLLDSTVGNRTAVGPFAYVRPGSHIGADCKVGDFVEVKNSTIGDGTKTSHLTYLGDADIGKNINFGCGVVIVNYDGSKKHRSTIGDGAFVGCNANLISPVNVGAGAYVAAGSTVTEDVPADALCVARERQRNIDGWAQQRGLYRK